MEEGEGEGEGKEGKIGSQQLQLDPFLDGKWAFQSQGKKGKKIATICQSRDKSVLQDTRWMDIKVMDEVVIST